MAGRSATSKCLHSASGPGHQGHSWVKGTKDHCYLSIQNYTRSAFSMVRSRAGCSHNFKLLQSNQWETLRAASQKAVSGKVLTGYLCSFQASVLRALPCGSLSLCSGSDSLICPSPSGPSMVSLLCTPNPRSKQCTLFANVRSILAKISSAMCQ